MTLFPYWLLFAAWTASALQSARRNSTIAPVFTGMLCLTAAFIGLRFEVGGDWLNYLFMKDQIYFQPITAALKITDPAYALLNWVAGRLNIGIWLPNLVCGAIFTAGLGRLAAIQPNPPLAILVSVPYFIIVVAMGYTRQAAAIGVICFALASASEQRVLRIIVLVAVATLFHKSAVVMLPIFLLPIFRRNVWFGVAGSIFFFVLFSAFLSNSSEQLINNYVRAGLESQGAAVRITMNVVAALLFISFRRRFTFTPFMDTYWLANAILAIMSLVGLVITASSTAVDRLSLFIIPLQVVVFSQLPYALSRTGRPLPSVMLGVIGYSLAVQFVWLNFADNRTYWLPYSTVLAPSDL